MALALGPAYNLVQGIDGSNDLHSAALSELVGIHAEKIAVCGVLSQFRYTDSYDDLVKVLSVRLPKHLHQWGNPYAKCTSGPMIQAAAMRLERDGSIWIAADTVVVLVPVTSTPVRAELLGRDGTVIVASLEPADLVILNDTGLRIRGGHFRFIMMAWEAAPRTTTVGNYYTLPTIHNMPDHGWTALSF